MPAGRGLIQLSRVDGYATASSFTNIAPPNVQICGGTVTFQVQVQNLRNPLLIPPGNVHVVDQNTGTVLGTATLDPASGTAIITATPTGNLGLVVKYDGYAVKTGIVLKRQFGASTSPVSPYSVNLLQSSTAVTTAANLHYCPDQDTTIAGATTRLGFPAQYPSSGFMGFKLWLDAFNFVDLPAGIVQSSGAATSIIPAGASNIVVPPADGYFLQALFYGSDCYASSNSPGGLSGVKVIPVRHDSTSFSGGIITVTNPPGGLCYTSSTTGTATILPTLLTAPNVGIVNVFETVSNNLVGSGQVVNGVANLTVDGYAFPPLDQASYPGGLHTFTLKAQYTDGYSCYADGYTGVGAGITLQLRKFFASVDAPVLFSPLPDGCASLPFTFNCTIHINGATNPLRGSFIFNLYKVGSPDTLINTFGAQTISPGVAADFTASGTITIGIMTFPNNYYVVGLYKPDGSNCYSANQIISAHSVTLTPSNC